MTPSDGIADPTLIHMMSQHNEHRTTDQNIASSTVHPLLAEFMQTSSIF